MRRPNLKTKRICIPNVVDRIKNGIISLTFRDPERSRSLNKILDAEYLTIGAI